MSRHSAKDDMPPLSVPRWTDMLSGLQARHPGFWIGLGNMESRLLTDHMATVAIEKPVYIAGLARSGTTILLELLSRHPQLCSHRYRDFPPVFTPWSWNWFIDRAGTDSRSAERAHGDGINVTSESPEAFEEVIWMAFFPKLHDPLNSSVLTAETHHQEFEQFYRDHIRKLLLIRGGRRYLSKANYNLTRFGYLLKLFPDARFILPIRNPVWHIASLMRQHTRFSEEHDRDPRLQRHMSRVGHFEFGLDRRPVNSGDTETVRKILEYWSDGREIEGWALYWQDVYGHVARLLETDAAVRRATLIVDYEMLCNHPDRTMNNVLSHCELSGAEADLVSEAARVIRHPSYYQPPFNAQQTAVIKSMTGPVKLQLDALACSRPHSG